MDLTLFCQQFQPVNMLQEGACIVDHFYAHIYYFYFFNYYFSPSQLKEAISRVPPNHVGEPLLDKPLGPVHMVNSAK